MERTVQRFTRRLAAAASAQVSQGCCIITTTAGRLVTTKPLSNFLYSFFLCHPVLQFQNGVSDLLRQ